MDCGYGIAERCFDQGWVPIPLCLPANPRQESDSNAKGEPLPMCCLPG
jgi:hypothetical protein